MMLVSNEDDPKLTWKDDKDNKKGNGNEGRTMTKKDTTIPAKRRRTRRLNVELMQI